MRNGGSTTLGSKCILRLETMLLMKSQMDLNKKKKMKSILQFRLNKNLICRSLDRCRKEVSKVSEALKL